MLYVLMIVAGCVSLAALILAFPRPVTLALSKIWPNIIWSGPEHTNSVSLTFDDGPDPDFTPQVLSLLKAHGVRATFFIVGERAEKYPNIVRQICAEGHEIANHTNTWDRTVSQPLQKFTADVVRSEQTLRRSQCFVKLFRPAGIFVRRSQVVAAQQLGYRVVLGSAYAFDPHRPSTLFITWAIRRALRPGAIVVLHDSGGNRIQSVRAIEAIVREARLRGLAFRRLSDLLDGTSPVNR